MEFRSLGLRLALCFGAIWMLSSSAVSSAVARGVRGALPRPGVETLTKTGPISLGHQTCPDGVLRATVTISSATIRRSQTLSIQAEVTNRGTTPCPYVGGPSGQQTIGPCGMISLEVRSARGQQIWPREVFHCPLLTGLSLSPGATVAASGTWNPAVEGGPGLGTYQVVVGAKERFSIRLR